MHAFLDRLWVRTAAFCALALVAAVVGVPLNYELSRDLEPLTEGPALGQLLNILSSSMLVIATFSLGTMASAFATASQTATPRAEPLLLGDSRSQTAVATFIGTFLFSVVAQLGLGLGLYSASGRVVLFGLTVVLLVAIVGTLVRWVDEIARLGRVQHTIDRLTEVAVRAAERVGASPHFGGYPYAELPDGEDVLADRVGRVQNIDVGAFDELARDAGGEVWLRVRPGAFCAPGTPLLRLVGWSHDTIDDARARAAKAIALGDRRTLDHDPAHAAVALSEVGSRALSPGVNDPGTAIDVVRALVSVFVAWAQADGSRDPGDVERPWLRVPDPDVTGALDRAVLPLIRDGAAFLEVQLMLQEGLAAVAHAHPRLEAAALELAGRACALSGEALPDASSRDALQRAYEAWAEPSPARSTASS